MPIVTADLEYRYSVTTGSAGDSTAGTGAGSLGKYMSTTEVVGADLFDDISGAENAAEDVEYRCVFVTNTHASLTAQSAKVWLSSETAGGADVAIGLDPVGVVAGDSESDQAATAADEGTAPGGVSFSSPTTEGAALDIGDVEPGECVAVWWRRTATDSAAVDDDGATLRFRCDTAA